MVSARYVKLRGFVQVREVDRRLSAFGSLDPAKRWRSCAQGAPIAQSIGRGIRTLEATHASFRPRNDSPDLASAPAPIAASNYRHVALAY
ncbi:hypothetical protein GCM10009857_34610 [Agromyces soli]